VSKPQILLGFQRYEADRHGVYQPTTMIGDDGPSAVALDAKGNLYVGNGGTKTIAIYAAGSGTGAGPSAIIAGPDTGLKSFGMLAADPKGNVFSIGPVAPNLLEYSAGSIGDAAPGSTIFVSPTLLTSPESIAVDAKDNIYVTNAYGPTLNKFTPGSIVIFGAQAGPIPKATISGAATGLIVPGAIAVDNAGKIYVANEGDLAAGSGLGPNTSGIVVFRAVTGGNAGNVKPIANITGASTGLGQIVGGIAVDGARNIYVSSIQVIYPPKGNKGAPVTYQPQIQVFAAGSNGNVAPIATITGDLTGLSGPRGITVGAAGQIYVADSGANSVYVYSPESNGNVAPVLTISRGASGARIPPTDITFDKSGNIYALQPASDTVSTVNMWAQATTDSPPIRTIAIATPSGQTALGLAVDASGNIYVAIPPPSNSSEGSVVEYAAGSAGDAQPARTLSVPDTRIVTPVAIRVDHSGNLYVLSWADNGTVSVFSADAEGDATPIQSIAGSNTELTTPEGLALDSNGAIYVENDAAAGPNTVPTVTIYSAGSTGDAAPEKAFETELVHDGLAVDAGGNIYVSNTFEVEIFPPGAGSRTKPQTFTAGGSPLAIFPAAQP